MNSRERRVIHIALRNETAVRSESSDRALAAVWFTRPHASMAARGRPPRTAAPRRGFRR